MRPGVSAVRFATEVAALAALAVAGLAIAWPLALALPAAFAFVRGELFVLFFLYGSMRSACAYSRGVIPVALENRWTKY